MSLLSHSFSTVSHCVPLCVDFVYITLLLRKGNSFYAIMMLGHQFGCSIQLRNIQRRKLIISGSSKGVTVQELMSFFSYFQDCLSSVDKATQIPIIRRSWQWSRLKNSNGLKLQYCYLARSSVCMPGIIVLVMNCHQRELYEAICFFLRYSQDVRIEI